ncbi:hypothetical protein FACS189468_6740 [Spirochaetia bacterium]|nr:hypothetical protein FACS189468_6740 [Spirochaetia bacterium]
MKQAFIFFLIFVLASAGLFSQELPEGGNRITAISVSGLKRTKPYVIEKPLQIYIGRDAGSIDKNEIIATLKSTGIVEPLSVEIEDNADGGGKILAIIVKEKWAIIPLPFFSIGSGGWAVGGAFMDTNAFGIKDTMMLMGSYGSSSWMANVMYIHSPHVVGDFGWNLMGMFLSQDKENTDQRDELTLRRYNSITINPSFGLSYKLTDLIMPSISVGYKNVMLRDTDSPVNAPEDGVQTISISPGIGIIHNTWDGYFLNEKSASLKYNYTLVVGDDDVHTVSLNAALTHSFIPGFRVTAKSGIIFATPSSSPFFESSPINASVNILPQTYSAVDFSSLSLGLEKYLFKFKFGTVSISAGYQVVYSNGELLHNQFDHGPVAMLQMYLSGIAIPGVGLGGAYNVDKNVWQYAFNVGMTF